MISRHLKTTQGRVLSFLAFILISGTVGAVVGYIDGSREAVGQTPLLDTSNALWIALLAGGIGATVSFIYGLYWMRSIDEAAQEAHKWSWYWGGSAGMAAGMAFVLASLAPATAKLQVPNFLSDRTDPVAYMAMGAMGMLLLMILGYGVAWVWWWWSRR